VVGHVAEALSGGEAELVGRLLVPSMAMIVTAVETRFFQREQPDDDSAQWYVAGTCVALTSAQVIVMSNQRTETADLKMLQLVVAACGVQGCCAFMTFVLWLRARHARLSPLQALHRCSSLSLPGISLMSLLTILSTPLSTPSPSVASSPIAAAGKLGFLTSPPPLLKGRIEKLHDLAAAGGGSPFWGGGAVV